MPDKLQELQSHRCFDGEQKVFSHDSYSTGCSMEFAIYLPPAIRSSSHPLPVLTYLSGLTCTWENFLAKAGAQRLAAELGIILVVPDTSPRHLDLPGENDHYDFGTGAGFYVDACQPPWDKHYRMFHYVTEELPSLIAEQFSVDPQRQGILGHSMGGHGALICALKKPRQYRTVSAFAPIVNPMDVPWGIKAFSGYLGEDRKQWRAYDASCLIADSKWRRPILIDQGTADNFLHTQLQPDVFADACQQAGIDLTLRMQPGYDHSYYFIASFIEDHIRWHARQW